jgi:hypothetical protein
MLVTRQDGQTKRRREESEEQVEEIRGVAGTKVKTKN